MDTSFPSGPGITKKLSNCAFCHLLTRSPTWPELYEESFTVATLRESIDAWMVLPSKRSESLCQLLRGNDPVPDASVVSFPSPSSLKNVHFPLSLICR